MGMLVVVDGVILVAVGAHHDGFVLFFYSVFVGTILAWAKLTDLADVKTHQSGNQGA